MKTLKIFIVLCFIAAFTTFTVQAQNRVQKYDVVANLGGQLFPCTGEYLWGEATIENWLSSNNWVTHVRKAMIIAVDEFGNQTNVYELSQTASGLNFMENTGNLKLNGKVIAQFHISYHTNTNANGDLVVDRFIMTFNCK